MITIWKSEDLYDQDNKASGTMVIIDIPIEEVKLKTA